MKNLKIICFVDDQGPSQIQKSIVNDLQKGLKNVEFKIVDVKSDGEDISKYNIKEFPSIIIQSDKDHMKFSGLTQQIFIERAIDKLLK
ncbi:MAG: thiol reductase thioredoxin [Candidatus Aenigmarchaeota archaeon]|nr:thiol reductase thioredoxin [Candidatus Aenigmarchaeota archaeon]